MSDREANLYFFFGEVIAITGRFIWNERKLKKLKKEEAIQKTVEAEDAAQTRDQNES